MGYHDRMASNTSQRARPKPATDSRGERLQRILAAAGLGSRRQCEELILAGRVELDRKTVTRLGTRADLDQQEVRVDGEVLRRSKRMYYAVHKPAGVISTSRDPQGRMRVIDLLPNDQRLYTVGRLDKSSEGLLIVTNDGDLANGLTHPRYGVEKTYLVQVAGHPTAATLAQLRKGVRLAETFARVDRLRIKRRVKQSTVLELVLSEGRNREIRRLLARVGHKVQRLQRIAIGPLRLGDMPSGTHRQLTQTELRSLRAAVANNTQKPTQRRSAKRRRKSAAGQRSR